MGVQYGVYQNYRHVCSFCDDCVSCVFNLSAYDPEQMMTNLPETFLIGSQVYILS